MIRRTIREWERIGYGMDETTIPAPQADRIAATARASEFSGIGGEGVLEHGRKGLRARGVVGVIATPDCQLENSAEDRRRGRERRRQCHAAPPADSHAGYGVEHPRRCRGYDAARLAARHDPGIADPPLLQQARRRGAPRHATAIYGPRSRPSGPARSSRCDAAILCACGLAAKARLPVRRVVARHRAQSGDAGGHQKALPSCSGYRQPARPARAELRLRRHFGGALRRLALGSGRARSDEHAMARAPVARSPLLR